MERDLYCDVDGVLLDFVNPSILIHDKGDYLKDPAFPPVYNYWGTMGLSDEEFWSKIKNAGPEWWYRLPKYPWCDDLVAFITECDPDWRVASKPTGPTGAAGRLQWIMENFPGRDFHICSDKTDMARPGRLLIDDNLENCVSWKKAGGDVVLVPAKTNGLLGVIPDVLSYVKSEIRRLGYAEGVTS